MDNEIFVNSSTERNLDENTCQSCSENATLADIEGNLLTNLQLRLSRAESQLSRTSEENSGLKQYVEELNNDLMELHAELFAEANKQVGEAKASQERAERLAEERDQENQVLRGEVTALKTLLITSTPSEPNRHLHPQLADSTANTPQHKRNSAFNKVIRGVEVLLSGKRGSVTDVTQDVSNMRSTSHHEISKEIAAADETELRLKFNKIDISHVDPKFLQSFHDWLSFDCPLPPASQSAALTMSSAISPIPDFSDQILVDDVLPCLTFRAAPELTQRILAALPSIDFDIETILPSTDSQITRCVLIPCKMCTHRLKFRNKVDSEASPEFLHISGLARNRIVTVCNLYTYLSLIGRGLLKSFSPEDQFRTIQRYRRDISLARLGFEPLISTC